MIIWISGPYGVGKTTLAEAMAAKMDNALVFDAEKVGNAVRGNYPDCPYGYIFEDYPLWGEFCYLLLKDIHEKFHMDILVPMTLLRIDTCHLVIYNDKRRALVIWKILICAKTRIFLWEQKKPQSYGVFLKTQLLNGVEREKLMV